MIDVKTNKALWKTSLIWAILISLPICILMEIDSYQTGNGFMPIMMYFLGTGLYILWSWIKGVDDGNFSAIVRLSCIANFLVIWLIMYVIMRIRRRRRREKVMQD